MTAAEALRDGARKLENAGIKGPMRDARWLMAEALGIAHDRLTIALVEPISRDIAARFQEAIALRLQRIPVSRILGRRSFYGRDFMVNSAVLDPRPETEGIVAHLLKSSAPRRVLDLGTGSGALAVTLLCECSSAVAVATDLSADALRVAEANARQHGVLSRMGLLKSDWFSMVEGEFDAIVCNPPYISKNQREALAPEVLGQDPDLALFAGDDGLSEYRRIASGLGLALADQGRAIFECGDGQTEAVAEIFATAGEFETTILEELGGRPRFVQVHNR